MSDITILIPVFDPTLTEKSKIERALKSISKQTDLPEVVIIGSSHTISYWNELEEITSGKFKLEFHKNSSCNATQNLNFLIGKSQTEFSKILFQDDFLKSGNSLQKIRSALCESSKKWLIHGCDHYYEQTNKTTRELVPILSGSIRRGINRVGAPSVVAFRNGQIPRFTEEMVYMFDCEWYLSMNHKFGNPIILKEPLVTIGIHAGQATNWAAKHLKSEVTLTKKLHPYTFRNSKCLCRKRDEVC
jgi:hypothetical protein